MSFRIAKKLLPIAASAAAFVGLAHAGAIYKYQNTSPTSVNTAGTIERLAFIYDEADQQLTFGSTFSANNGALPDAGWFVLSPGDNPRGNATELAIFYLDFVGRDVYTYAYDGVNGFNSYQNQDAHINTFNDVLSVNNDPERGLIVSFNSLDISSVNNFMGGEWTGAAFGDDIGVWAHFTAVDEFSVSGDQIALFDAGVQSFFDTTSAQPTRVPEPAGLAMLGLVGIGGAVAMRRRKAK